MNNSNRILLIDPAFDPATSSACNLLVKIGIDSFSYAIINRQNNKVIALYDEHECEEINLKLSERFRVDPYLTLVYNEIKIALPTSNVINIPNVFYDEYAVKYHEKLFSSSNDERYTRLQQHFNYTSIFSISKNIDSIVTKHFPLAHKLQENSGLTTYAEGLTNTSLILDFSVGSFQVIYVSNQQIVFQQSYEIAQIEEFNYYLLFMINQLAIDPKESTLFLSGIIHENDERHSCILKYFRNIQFIVANNDLDKEILDDMPLHYYSNLLALDKCVS